MKKPFYKILYVQVLFAIVAGVLLGVFYPSNAVDMKPLGDGFIKLIKMIIAPVIFCTVVSGIAGMQDVKKIGRVGGKALLYFEVVSTFALAIGLLVANILKPGAGFNADPAHLDAKSIAPKLAPQALQTLRAATEGPRLIFPPDGATVQVEALGLRSRGLVLAAGGDDLTWYVGGAPLAADPVSGRVVWRPAAPGFYRLSVVDGQGRKASARVRIKAG